MINKVALFYRFAPLADPIAVRLWQHSLCSSLGLTGRIILSHQGINGTLGGDVKALKQYAKITREHPAFADLDVKWSDAAGQAFPRLSVKVREEVVTFGAPGELTVDQSGVVGTGTHLSPEQVHQLVEQRGDDVVFFDGRNRFEAEIGRFEGAVVTGADTTRDFVAELDSGRYDELKDRPVITYCTGGIRCEVLSSMMINRGFSEVYQIDGGIARYGERFGDSGLWQGSLYVFDDRLKINFSDDSMIIGHCEVCTAPTSDYRDCVAPQCKGRALLCDEHATVPLCKDHR